MKPGKVVALVAAGGALAFLLATGVLWNREDARRIVPREVAAWLPASTLVLIEAQDIVGTQERVKELAIWKMLQQPEVASFLEKPLARIPASRWRSALDEGQIRQGFVAVIGSERKQPLLPGWVVGLRYRGSREGLDQQVARYIAKAIEKNPMATLDLIQYRGVEVQQLASIHEIAAIAYLDDWLLFANRRDVLSGLIDRYRHPGSRRDSLHRDRRYLSTLHGLKRGSPADLRLYFQLEPVAQILAQIAPLKVIIQNAKEEMEGVNWPVSLAATLQLEGPLFIEEIFGYDPKLVASSSTLRPEQWKASLPDSPLLLLQRNRAWREGSEESRWVDVSLGALWPEADRFPSLFVRSLWDQELGGQLSAADFGSDESSKWAFIEGKKVQTLTQEPLDVHSLREGEFLTLGIGSRGMASAISLIGRRGDVPTLLDSPRFQAAAASLSIPCAEAGGLFYLDLAGWAEALDRRYRPSLPLLAALYQGKGDPLLPLDRLPPVERFSPYLPPFLSLWGYRSDGSYMESSGPLPMSQTLIGAIILAGVYWEPYLKGWDEE